MSEHFSLGAGVGSDVPMLSGCARLSAAETESLVQSGSIRCCFTRMHSPPSPPAHRKGIVNKMMPIGHCQLIQNIS